jgi:hypothetical protein
VTKSITIKDVVVNNNKTMKEHYQALAVGARFVSKLNALSVPVY